jgi:hypothetical protein
MARQPFQVKGRSYFVIVLVQVVHPQYIIGVFLYEMCVCFLCCCIHHAFPTNWGIIEI